MHSMIRIPAVTVCVLMLLGSRASADLWCSNGPDQQPDHACDGDRNIVSAAAAKYEALWTKQYPGVSRVTAGMSNSYGYMELDVLVDPASLVPAITAALPSEADGFPVHVYSYPPTDVSTGGDQADAGTSSSTQTEAEKDSLARAMDDAETKSWEKLPGVIAIGWQESDGDHARPEIVVQVQDSMMESVRKEIPASKFGIPIVLESAYQTIE